MEPLEKGSRNENKVACPANSLKNTNILTMTILADDKSHQLKKGRHFDTGKTLTVKRLCGGNEKLTNTKCKP